MSGNPVDGYEAQHMVDGAKVLHTEKQVGPWYWHAGLLSPGIVGAVAMLASMAATGMLAVGIVSSVVIALLFAALWILFAVLRTVVTSEALHVQFGIWGPKIPIADVVEVEAVSYNWKKYGGFGIRKATDGSWLYNMVGDGGHAVKVRWRDGGKEKVTLIGSKEAGSIVAAVQKAQAESGDRVAPAVGEDLAEQTHAPEQVTASIEQEAVEQQ